MKDFVAGGAASLAGGVALMVALGLGADRAWLLSRAQTASGTVVELQVNEWSNSTRAGKYPVVEFREPGGETARVSGMSSYPPRYQVGQKVDVYYVEGDPGGGRIDDWLQMWLAITISGGIALIALPMGLVILGLAIRARRIEGLRERGIAVVGTVRAAKTSSVEHWGKTVQYLTVEVAGAAGAAGAAGSAGAVRWFVSHAVPGKGDEWIGRQVRVFVDPGNPRRFLVDAPKP